MPLRILLAELATCCLISSSAALAGSFTDVTASVGISYNQFATLGPGKNEAYYMTGGAAAVDYDNDGWMDLFVTRMDAPCILYRNRGGFFEAIPAESIGISLPWGANGAILGDINNDGYPDLYITTLGTNRNFLYINQRDGHFIESALVRGAAVENPELSLQSGAFGFGAAFGDYDRDGFLDLFTTTWDDRATDTHSGGIGTRLLRNIGQQQPGFFVDATEEAGVAMNLVPRSIWPDDATFAFAPRFCDLDGDGFPELAVAADFGSSRLFWNNGNGTFTDGTLTAGVGTDENGMGSAIGDFDGDGLMDWFVTSIYDESQPPRGGWGRTGNRLYRNRGGRQFVDMTSTAGVRDGGWGWGASFLDYDNDGDLDIIMTNGMDVPGSETEDHFNHDRMRLWRNNGNGVFTEVSLSEGITDTRSGKGLVVFDYNNDGAMDVFAVNTGSTPVLYRNTPTNNWLKVKLQGKRSNRDGIGAVITLIPDLSAPTNGSQTRFMDGGNNFLGQNERVVHFGLSTRTNIDRVLIKWPSGWIQKFDGVPANIVLTAVETSDYQQWREQYFTPAELQNPALSGDAADLDFDGRWNVCEYTLGSDPRVVDTSTAFATALQVISGTNCLVIWFDLDKRAVDAVVTAEIAERIEGQWTNLGPAETVFESALHKRIRAFVPISDSTRFLRIKVSVPNVAPGL